MVRTFLMVYMELGSYFLFLQEQIKNIIITRPRHAHTQNVAGWRGVWAWVRVGGCGGALSRGVV